MLAADASRSTSQHSLSARHLGIVAAHPLLALDPMSTIDTDRVERLQLDVDLPYAVLPDI
ncbi:MAG: hypothetical protein R2706_13385 [Acidimicrobiales bacterium]